MFYKGEHMPTKEISLSSEGRDQRSDSPTKDVASSNNRRVGDFATRSETHQYAVRKDTQSSSEHSSTSASEIIASLDASWFERLVLSNNPMHSKSDLLGKENSLGEKFLASRDQLTIEDLQARRFAFNEQVDTLTNAYRNLNRKEAEQVLLKGLAMEQFRQGGS
jgi:hypothetical protein